MRFEPPDLPSIPNIQPALADFLRRLMMWANRQFQYKISTDIAVDGVLLLSPGGKVYKVSVNDSGVVTTALVALGSHP